jgi:hypothetical protein
MKNSSKKIILGTLLIANIPAAHAMGPAAQAAKTIACAVAGFVSTNAILKKMKKAPEPIITRAPGRQSPVIVWLGTATALAGLCYILYEKYGQEPATDHKK